MAKRLDRQEEAYVETDKGYEYEEYTVGGVLVSMGANIGYALIYIVMVLGISVVLACVGWIVANDVLALNKVYSSVTLTITDQDDFESVSQMLKDEDIIDYRIVFDLFATITKSKEDISAGIYTVDTEMDYNALIRNLGKNSSTKTEIEVTIPEGYTTDQIFALLAEKGIASVEDLEKEAAYYPYKFDFLQEIPLGDHRRLEGYLFPDTYSFYSNHDPVYAINKMLANYYSRVIGVETINEKIASCGYTMHEVLIMASMIERETDGTDRGKIASVIFNRMENPYYETNGRLQIDATIYYLTGREVTQNDRETIENPYNTHINAGLPPGPICNPGIESILAVLNPINEGYFYYALGDDGFHHYYKSYSGLSSFIASQERYN